MTLGAIIKNLILAGTSCVFLAGTSHVKPKKGEPLANQLFGALHVASKQKSQVVGYYAHGCLAGGVQLPETGPTWQAMRLSRNRNWGHPSLISFIERLSREAEKQGWAGLYVGDMSQPRGGPMTSSHASHQDGLDVDIWMLPPKRVNLSRSARERISSISVRSADQKSVNANWTPAHMAILKAASKDRSVERIFVAAAIKIAMCKTAGSDRRWLKKIRPLFGHEDHFHVRLKCPRGSPNCEKQAPVSQISKGDGCDKTLTWWVTDYLARPKADTSKKKKTKKIKKTAKPGKRRARQMIMADLPRQCQKVLTSE